MKELLQGKEFNCDFFNDNALNQIIYGSKYELFILFDLVENDILNIRLSEISGPVIIISETSNLIKTIDHPLVHFIPKKDLNSQDLVTKINKLLLYPDLNKVIENVLDDTDISVIIFDEERIIDFVNSALCQQTGYKREEIIRKNISILYSDEHSIMFYDNIFHTVRNNLKWSGQLQLKRKDGSTFWEECVIKPLKKYEHNQYYVGILLNRDQSIKNKAIQKREVEMAAAIQNSILSKPIINQKLAIDAKYYPLSQISGDTYHWEPLDDNKYIVLLCDVIGHGIGSALVTTVISSIIRDLKSQWTTSESFLKNLNNTIIELLSKNKNSQDYYFTAVFLEVDTQKQTIKYFNCGHPPIYYFNNKTLDELHVKNFPIGLFKDYSFSSKTITYKEPMELLLYTDGLKDLDMDYDSGLNVLERILKRYPYESNDLLEFIEQEYLEHYYDKVKDDISLISIKLF
jgi:sigma-B regulation protein RsbU (phosphoserine phosphatase)